MRSVGSSTASQTYPLLEVACSHMSMVTTQVYLYLMEFYLPFTTVCLLIVSQTFLYRNSNYLQN